MQDVERVGTRLELGYNVLSTRITTCRRVRGQLKVGVFRVRARGAEERSERGGAGGREKKGKSTKRNEFLENGHLV